MAAYTDRQAAVNAAMVATQTRGHVRKASQLLVDAQFKFGSSYTDRQAAVNAATMAMETSRHVDASIIMKDVALMEVSLIKVERDLLKSSYKNVIKDILRARSTLIAKMQREGGDDLNIVPINDYLHRIETELIELCTEIKYILDEYLIPEATSEDQVFYQIMIAKHFRYRADFRSGNQKRELAIHSRTAYEMGMEIAIGYLPIRSLMRLTLAKNYSSLLHDMLNLPHSAVHILCSAVDPFFIEHETDNDPAATLMLVSASLARLRLWTSTLNNPNLIEDD